MHHGEVIFRIITGKRSNWKCCKRLLWGNILNRRTVIREQCFPKIFQTYIPKYLSTKSNRIKSNVWPMYIMYAYAHLICNHWVYIEYINKYVIRIVISLVATHRKLKRVNVEILCRYVQNWYTSWSNISNKIVFVYNCTRNRSIYQTVHT